MWKTQRGKKKHEEGERSFTMSMVITIGFSEIRVNFKSLSHWKESPVYTTLVK